MSRFAMLLLGLFCAAGARAGAPYDDPLKTEGWAWAQIRADRPADFNIRCGRSLDPHRAAGWDDPCRQVSPQFLEDVLTQPELAKQIRQHGVRLRGAHIAGPINLSEIEVQPQLWIDASRIEGNVYLADTDWHRTLSLQGTTIAGNLMAERLRSDSIVFVDERARVDGDADFASANIKDGIYFDRASVGGSLNLESVEVPALFINGYANVNGDLKVTDARIDGNLSMDDSTFAGPVQMVGARVGGTISMQRAYFSESSAGIAASRLTVAGSLFMRQHAFFGGPVNLVGAAVGSNMELSASSFLGPMNLSSIAVAGELLMGGQASFERSVGLQSARIGGNLDMSNGTVFGGGVSLVGAKIGSDLEMQGSSFGGGVDLNSVDVAVALFMTGDAAFNGAVDLVAAKTGGNLEMETSSFSGPVTAGGVNVGGSLLGYRATFKAPLSLVGARIGGTLSLAGAAVSRVDLSEVDAQELLLNGLGWWCQRADPAAGPAKGVAKAAMILQVAQWPLGASGRQVASCGPAGAADPPELLLRNSHFGQFQDTDNAWSPRLDLEGFHYDRLGGLGDSTVNPMLRRADGQWRDWLERDPAFSTQPYSELGAVLAAAGNKDAAEAVEYAGHERERRNVCGKDGFVAPRCLWLLFLDATAGYGIERYMFRVLWWVFGLTGIGVVVLCFSPNARRHGAVWMTGASLHRLLPIVSLYKEFDDFFDNKSADLDPLNLKPWQVFYFALHAIFGWALGLILLAAMSGLTQKG